MNDLLQALGRQGFRAPIGAAVMCLRERDSVCLTSKLPIIFYESARLDFTLLYSKFVL